MAHQIGGPGGIPSMCGLARGAERRARNRSISSCVACRLAISLESSHGAALNLAFMRRSASLASSRTSKAASGLAARSKSRLIRTDRVARVIAARYPLPRRSATSVSAVSTSASEGFSPFSACNCASRASRFGSRRAEIVRSLATVAAAIGSNTGVVRFSKSSATPLSVEFARGGMRSKIRPGSRGSRRRASTARF